MKKMSLNVFAVLFLVAGWTQSALAIPMLDQSLEGGGSAGVLYTSVPGGSKVQWGQVFTVGTAGVLTGLEVDVWRDTNTTEDLLWDLRTVVAGDISVPNAGANILASGSLAAASIGEISSWISLTSTLTNTVAVGDVLALTMRSNQLADGANAQEAYKWRRGDGYADGSAAFRSANANPWSERDGDMNFRTYVDACDPAQQNCNPVPAPATLILLGLGLLGLGWSRRSQR